ncbi:DJ-1/PfpI family protein [Mesorhizobium sp. CO1-1-8]|uniref:DJ-1/PfpI family protein n=1 Tax=Mesorhizobium sp. CO1-1-8 TaxID=2876631 RepID=UPI001CD0CD93|nr:DJ-1/PfpI family protein [Mesorhizobium sp. CO1-1-8]MBZ9772538.1 DJ-1/PfpI family protein [Mesorhizobium sp. CO1-1-8]
MEQLPASEPKPLTVAMLIYPGMTLIDFAGPQLALGLHGKTHHVWKTLEPVVSDTGVSVNPTDTYGTCPRDVDVLFVGGATDPAWLMEDRETMDFLVDVARSARYVTSVCTGSLLLGAAGLLDGYKSSCHWAYIDALRALGVDATDDRITKDRNRLSGGGATAGVDYGIAMLAELRGESVAKVTQLIMQYAPEPPFVGGSPRLAEAEVTKIATDILAPFVAEGIRIATSVGRERKERAVAA